MKFEAPSGKLWPRVKHKRRGGKRKDRIEMKPEAMGNIEDTWPAPMEHVFCIRN